MTGRDAGWIAGALLAALAAGLCLRSGPHFEVEAAHEDEDAGTSYVALQIPPAAPWFCEPLAVSGEPPPTATEEATGSPEPESGPVPLRVVVRDGTTGDVLRGAKLKIGTWWNDAGAVDLGADELREAHELRDRTPLRGGHNADFQFQGTLPDGFVFEADGMPRLEGRISRFAKAVELDLIAWPEAEIRLCVVEEDGRPVAGAKIRNGWCAGRCAELGCEPTDARGETRVRGVPGIRGEFVRVDGFLGERWARSVLTAIPASGREGALRVVLPRECGDWSWETEGASGGIFCGRPGQRRPGKTGVVEARVLRQDGRPAGGVRVLVTGLAKQGRTDAEGRVELRDVPAGSRTLRVIEPGFVVEPRIVEVPSEGSVEAILRQVEGRRTVVTVRDHEGREVAGASIGLGGVDDSSTCVMVGDTQRFGVATGPDGTAALTGLPCDEVLVTARLGSRCGWTQVLAGNAAEIVLSRPEGATEQVDAK